MIDLKCKGQVISRLEKSSVVFLLTYRPGSDVDVSESNEADRDAFD